MDPELERLAKLLGPERPDVRGLLNIAARSTDGARIALHVFRAKSDQAGMNPYDLSAFPLVEELPQGAFRVGRVINGTALGPVFALPQGSRANIQHVAIAGETRSGKSCLLTSLVQQHGMAGGRFWLFDVENEYTRLVNALHDPFKPLVLAPRHLRFNFFEPPNDFTPWKNWLEDLGLRLRGDMFLRDGSINLFDEEMRQLIERKGLVGGRQQFPSLFEALSHFRDMKFGGAKVRSSTWLESLVNRLTMLANTFEDTVHVTHSDMLAQLATRSVIFQLRSLRGLQLQFLTNYLVSWLARHCEVISR